MEREGLPPNACDQPDAPTGAPGPHPNKRSANLVDVHSPDPPGLPATCQRDGHIPHMWFFNQFDVFACRTESHVCALTRPQYAWRAVGLSVRAWR